MADNSKGPTQGPRQEYKRTGKEPDAGAGGNTGKPSTPQPY
jgi:hypothetical protein